MSEPGWRPIAGYLDIYEISRDGQVRGVPRRARFVSRSGRVFTRRVPARLRRPKRRHDGDRWRIVLCCDGVVAERYIDQLVEEAWGR